MGPSEGAATHVTCYSKSAPEDFCWDWIETAKPSNEQVNNIPDQDAKFLQGNYADLPEILAQLDIASVDAILLDLGLSSDQLADTQRGFSFNTTGRLDLRFNQSEGEPAWKLLNRLSPEHLADLIYQYGEDRLSRRIARAIVKARQEKTVETADQLASIVRRCYPRQRNETLDPATRTFQALRIAVNDELKWLDVALRRLPDCLAVGGRLGHHQFSLPRRPACQTRLSPRSTS